MIVSGKLSSCPLVELVLGVVRDLGDLLLGEQREQLPCLIQRIEDGSVLVEILLDELRLESIVKQEVVVIVGRQCILTNDCLHGVGILTLSVERVHLVGNLWVIGSGHALTNGVLHETGQRWQDVDWWVDASSRHVSVDVDLALSDVTSQIWDWMGDIIVRHGQDGDLGDGAERTVDTTSTLINGGQISVHVTWISSTTRHFLSGGRDLTESVSIGCHIGEDGEDVHVFLVRQVLGGREGQSWRNDTLDGWVVGVVHEEDDTVHGAVHLELLLEETSGLQVDTHSGEDQSEILIGVIQHILALDEGGLTADLGTNVVVRETGSGEKRNLLSSGNRGHGIDGGDTRLDHFLWIHSLVWVDWLTLY